MSAETLLYNSFQLAQEPNYKAVLKKLEEYIFLYAKRSVENEQ